MPSTSRITPRLVAVLVLAAVWLTPLPALATTDEVVSRTFGPDRIATAVEASADYRDHATDALLATAFSFPDALAAGALAHRLEAPLLLTGHAALPQAVADELVRLGVRTVWILGGPGAVSADVEATLRDLGYGVRRLAGESRYATAREIATAAGPSVTGEVVLALGEHADPSRAWPDAVAAGALAATPDRIPTVLTRPDSLPQETIDALRILRAREVIIAGGAGVISAEVQASLEARGYRVRRIAGSSRYDTSVALATEALSRFPAGTRPAVFASGQAFPDALSAGSLAASLGAPLMLVPPTAELPGSSERFLRDHAEQLGSGVIVGGPAAADAYVMAQLDAALQGKPRPAPREEPTPTSTTDQPATTAGPADGSAGPADGEQDGEPTGELGETFTGNASWYGPGFDGNPTASGETFDQEAMTAAHRTLPFGTVLRVTNQDNGRTVEVRINDRGPYGEDRVLDLSAGAAEVLDMTDAGVVPVSAEVIAEA